MQTTTSCRKALSAFGLPVFATEAPLPVSLFLSVSPPPTFTFSLSRLSLSTSRLPPLFSLEHSSHFQKKQIRAKIPRRPSLTDRRSGRHWGDSVSVHGARVPPVLGPWGLRSYLPNSSRPCPPATSILLLQPPCPSHKSEINAEFKVAYFSVFKRVQMLKLEN